MHNFSRLSILISTIESRIKLNIVLDYKLDLMINFIADTSIIDDVIDNNICKVKGQNFVAFGVPYMTSHID